MINSHKKYQPQESRYRTPRPGDEGKMVEVSECGQHWSGLKQEFVYHDEHRSKFVCKPPDDNSGIYIGWEHARIREDD